MDPEIVNDVRLANEACIALVTLMIAEESRTEAAQLAASEPIYSKASTCMAVANLAVSALRTLAGELDIDPLDLVRVAALSAAQHHVELEQMMEDEEE